MLDEEESCEVERRGKADVEPSIAIEHCGIRARITWLAGFDDEHGDSGTILGLVEHLSLRGKQKRR